MIFITPPRFVDWTRKVKERKSKENFEATDRTRLVPHGNIENVRRPHVFFKIAQTILGADFSDKRLLDVACGDNFLLRELVEAGASYVGVEARQTNIDNAWGRVAESLRSRVTFKKARAQDVSARNYGEFDLILVAGLLYHMSHFDQFELLVNLRGMCKGGLLIDTTLTPEQHDKTYYYALNGCIYSGTGGLEHAEGDSKKKIEGRLRASYSDKGDYPSFIQTRSCLVRMLRNLGFDQVLEYCYPGNLNDFNMAIGLDNLQTVGSFRANMRRVLVAPVSGGISELRAGPFGSVRHDGRYGSIGDQGMEDVAVAVRDSVRVSSVDDGYVRGLDDLFQTLPLKLNYMALLFLLCEDLPVSFLYRFVKGYLDPIIRYGSLTDRERALALFVALVRRTEGESTELASYSAESFALAFQAWFPFNVQDFVERAVAGDRGPLDKAKRWLSTSPFRLPDPIEELLRA